MSPGHEEPPVLDVRGLAYAYPDGHQALYGVDLQVHRGEVLGLVRQLAEDGATILMATHEMAFARDVAHRVVFLDEGRVLEEGPPAQGFGAPREARTREFLTRFRA